MFPDECDFCLHFLLSLILLKFHQQEIKPPKLARQEQLHITHDSASFILFHFLFYFKLTVLRKGTLFKHILGHSFLSWCLLKLFFDQFQQQSRGDEENQGSCGLYERGRQWKTKIVERQRAVWNMGSDTENPQGGTPWEIVEYWGLKDFSGVGVDGCASTTSFFLFSLAFSSSHDNLLLSLHSCLWPPPFHFHATCCGKTKICEFTIFSSRTSIFSSLASSQKSIYSSPPSSFPCVRGTWLSLWTSVFNKELFSWIILWKGEN